MAKKIILYLSLTMRKMTKEELEDLNSLEYHDEKREISVSGRQTNEAPVKYLLKKDPEISEIICILSEEVREGTFSYFEQMLKEEGYEVRCIPVNFDKTMTFDRDVLPKIVGKISREDEIYLDLTGGFRNSIMHLLIVCRALAYNGTHLVQAVYGNFDSRTIEDVTQTLELFDLIAGMQEITSFGNVRTLKAYYKPRIETQPEKYALIKDMIQAAEDLFETIIFCRVQKINGKMTKFNEILEKIKIDQTTDPVFNALFPAFRQIFGRDKKLSIKGVIRWCLKSDMIQQALTIYTEKIPAEIFKPSMGLFTQKAEMPEKLRVKKEYEDEDMKLFYEDFLLLSKKSELYPVNQHQREKILEYAEKNKEKILKGEYLEILRQKIPENDFLQNRNKKTGKTARDRIHTIENMEEAIENSGYKLKCTIEQIQAICRDYLYIKLLRNMVNHSNVVSSQEDIVEYLKEKGYMSPETITIDGIKEIMESALRHIELKS